MTPEPAQAQMQRLIADLADEWAVTDVLMSHLGNGQWSAPTPAQGWRVSDQIAHLATIESAALAACRFADPTMPKTAREARGTSLSRSPYPNDIADRAARFTGRAPKFVVHAAWRQTRKALANELAQMAPDRRIPWFGRYATPATMIKSRVMEVWAHTVDIADAIDVPIIGTDRLRHTAELAARNQARCFAHNKITAPPGTVRLELNLPSGTQWVWGPRHTTERIIGDALEFCLVAVRRRHREDTNLQAVGYTADQWLEVVQAFAGPPGPGRPPLGT